MGLGVKFCVVFVISTIVVSCVEAQMMKQAYMTTPQLISEAGYPVEKHRVKTEDGYILQVHRIPAGRRTARRARPSAKGKPAILLAHGLLGSSGDWVLLGPDRSLSYLLADAGYDVWMANLRGNIYTSHKNISKTEPRFWNYSFHEHGKYDVAATIDKILKVTGLPKILYIGFSMGGTSFFTMLSQRPEYNDKLIGFIGLAPAVYVDHMKEFAMNLAVNLNLGKNLRAQGIYALSLPRPVHDMILTGFCNARREEDDVCMRLVYSLVGEDYGQNDWEISPLMLARVQPASCKQLEHFAKFALTGEFVEFGDNLLAPGKPYKLSNVKIPVTLLYGENDKLTPKNQTIRLAAALNQTGMLEDVRPGCSWPKFNHLDFGFARDLGKMLNQPLIDYIDKIHDKYTRL